MNYLKLFPLSVGFLLFASCQQSTTIKDSEMKNETEKTKALDQADMDLSVKPGNNFFEYSNGGWIKANPVPSDRTQYGSFTVLYDNNEKKLKSLVDDLQNAEKLEDADAQKIAAIFKAGMDTVAINKAGYTPIEDALAKVDVLESKEDMMTLVAKMHQSYQSPFFHIMASQDDKNSQMIILHMYQGGLGMPDRDYYINDDERTKELRNAYANLIKEEFVLLGNDEATAEKMSVEVMEVETVLAKNSLTRLELRDPFTTYNKTTVEDLQKLSPAIDWANYFSTVGLEGLKDLNIGTVNFVKELSNVIEKTDLSVLKTYLKWNIVNGAASFLSSDFENAKFDFYGKTLSGQQEMRPRWKRVLGTTNGALGEAVGKLYVEKYFPQEAKDRMLKLVENLRTAFAGRIQKLDWMSDITKEKALAKLNAITVKVGYPDKWKDYTALNINNSQSYYENAQNAMRFAFADNIKKVGKPYDKLEWGMTPQTVNAYYSPNANEIVFPAAILQAPFFNMDADDAVNYGAIGVVIGHEMTHGFDDQGRNYDLEGNLNNWWTEDDAIKFEEKTKVIVNQFDNYVVLDSLHVDGKLTLGENIADLGGLSISWDAYQMTDEAKANESVDGFTTTQRFYLSYATIWRQTILDEELTRRLKEDVHSPGDARVNVPLFNIDRVYEAFDIEEGDKLFRAKEDRANIW